MSGWWGITRRFVYIYLHASLPINQTLYVLIRSTITETLIRVKLEVYASKANYNRSEGNRETKQSKPAEEYYGELLQFV